MKLPILLPPYPYEGLYGWMKRGAAANLIPENIFSTQILRLSTSFFTSGYSSIPVRMFYPLVQLLPDLEGSVIPPSVLISNHTVLSLLPFWRTNSEITFIIHSLFNTYPNQFSLLHLNTFKSHCTCPECEKENSRHPQTDLIPHQIPGVTVCWKHGCSLVTSRNQKTRLLNQNPRPMDQDFAVFCKRLLDANIFTTFGQIQKIIISLAEEKSQAYFHTFCVPKRLLGHLCAEVSKTPLSENIARLVQPHRTYSHFGADTKLALLFLLSENDPGKVIQDLTIPDPVWDEASLQISLIESHGWIIKVRCDKCGHQYYTTRFAIKNRLNCPLCGPELTGAQFAENWIHKASGGVLEVLSPFTGLEQPIRVRNVMTGKERDYMKARYPLLYCDDLDQRPRFPFKKGALSLSNS